MNDSTLMLAWHFRFLVILDWIPAAGISSFQVLLFVVLVGLEHISSTPFFKGSTRVFLSLAIHHSSCRLRPLELFTAFLTLSFRRLALTRFPWNTVISFLFCLLIRVVPSIPQISEILEKGPLIVDVRVLFSSSVELFAVPQPLRLVHFVVLGPSLHPLHFSYFWQESSCRCWPTHRSVSAFSALSFLLVRLDLISLEDASCFFNLFFLMRAAPYTTSILRDPWQVSVDAGEHFLGLVGAFLAL